jgi:translation initiation factor 1
VPQPGPARDPEPVGDGVVRVSRTKAGRKGKTVTLVTGLPPADREAVGKELKRLCGSGGAVKDGVVEIQGDHREKVAAHLGGRYRVKLAGG